ncbi:MAG TPA: SOS response-associated peptidase family protein, partial [Saprospiraceae bacterium]|nr:SOS response-associated peptidase family protein [Saprospiraceae bacterium]
MLLNTEYKHPNTEEMCGRSSLTKTEKELEERFHSTFYSEDLERYNPLPNYNVAPTQVMPVITNDDPDHFRPMRWGLIPFWAKDEKIGYKMINARIETLLEKSSFRT